MMRGRKVPRTVEKTMLQLWLWRPPPGCAADITYQECASHKQ